MKRRCPECAVTIAYEDTKQDIIQEWAALAERLELAPEGTGHDYRWRWSLEKVLSDIQMVAGVDARVGGEGLDLAWTVPLKSLVLAYRQERSNFKRAKDAEERAKAKK